MLYYYKIQWKEMKCDEKSQKKILLSFPSHSEIKFSKVFIEIGYSHVFKGSCRFAEHQRKSIRMPTWFSSSISIYVEVLYLCTRRFNAIHYFLPFSLEAENLCWNSKNNRVVSLGTSYSNSILLRHGNLIEKLRMT